MFLFRRTFYFTQKTLVVLPGYISWRVKFLFTTHGGCTVSDKTYLDTCFTCFRVESTFTTHTHDLIVLVTHVSTVQVGTHPSQDL